MEVNYIGDFIAYSVDANAENKIGGLKIAGINTIIQSVD